MPEDGLPTKQDMEGYIRSLQSTYKAEIQIPTTNLSQLSDQVQRIEGDMASVYNYQVVQDQISEQHTQQIKMFNIAEDHENRNHRNNLRIVSSVPETALQNK